MKTRMIIIAAAVILLTLGLTIFLQQTGFVSADDITVTIAGPAGPTNVSPIPLTISFNADVTEFELGNIDVVNGTASDLDGEDDTYTVDITPDVTEGLVTVDIAADVVAEGNAAAETFSVYFDSVAPTVTINSTSPDPTGNPLIPITLTFSEEVTVLDSADIVVTNGDKVGYTFSLPVSTLTIDAENFGNVIVDIAAGVVDDMAGNQNEAAETFAIEYVDQPWVTIEQATTQDDPTPVPPIVFDVIFSETIIGFETEDVDLTGTTAPGELIVEIQAVPDTLNRYTVSVSGMTGPGIVKASIPADVVEDDEGNLNLPSTSVDNEVTFEGPVPTVLTIERVQANPTKAESVNFYVTFSEVVNSVGVEDFILTTSGDIDETIIQYVVGTGDQRFVSVLTGVGAGTIRLDVAADAEIFDLDGFAMIELPFVSGEVYDVRIESFADVSVEDWAWRDIEILFAAGLTDGYPTDPVTFGPDREVTRAEMAKFILQAIHGEDYEPDLEEEDKGVFEDVDYENEDLWYLDWVDDLYAQGLTDGCNPTTLQYCPEESVTRAQMAKFLLIAINGDPEYLPELEEEDKGVFEDVDYDADLWYLDWIDALYKAEITTGCSEDPLWYCPDDPVLRKEMAAFLVRAFELGD